MKKEVKMPESKGKKKKILLIIIIVLILASAYFTLIFSKKCATKECFEVSQARCERASYVNNAPEATWLYKIEGKKLFQGTCAVYVKSIDMQNTENSAALKGKEMICYIPMNVVVNPESNLDSCHGLLKEAMQDLIIEKMHLYIVQNLGEIKESLETI